MGQDEAPPGKEDEVHQNISLPSVTPHNERELDMSEVKQHVSILDKTDYRREDIDDDSLRNGTGQLKIEK